MDGASLASLIGGESRLSGSVYGEWVGDQRVPTWWQMRTEEFAYIELGTGERELYDLRVDPLELTNVIDDPAYASDVERLSAQLELARSS